VKNEESKNGEMAIKWVATWFFNAKKC
jgi:hypothetical protein